MADKEKPQLKSAFELFVPSVELIKKYLGIYFLLLVLPVLLSYLDSFSETALGPFTTLGGLLSLVFLAPLIYAEVRTAGGHSVTLGECFQKGYKYFWRLLGLLILVGIIIVVGLVALIVPGLIMARRYALAPYMLVDRDLSISEAMRQAADESKPFSWSIYGIFGVVFLVAMISIFGVVGMVASAILSVLYSLAIPLRYFEIKKAYKAL